MLAFLLACRPETEPPEAFPPDQAELEVLIREYVDTSRGTAAMGEAEAREERLLATRIWIGPSPGKEAPSRPLLLMLHGVDGHPDKFELFASTLAEAGIVVAGPAFPLSNRDSGAGPGAIVDTPEQVLDADFVLDQLLLDVADEGSPLWKRFDPERIVGFGHSMGGATLLGRTRFGEGDDRFLATAYLSAALQLEPLLEGELQAEGVPTLVMQGLEDLLVPPTFGEQLHERLAEPKWYLGLAGAEHSDPVESQESPPIPVQQAALDAVMALIDEIVHGQAGAVDAVLERLASDGHTVY